MANKKVWDFNGMENKRIIVSALAMGSRGGVLVAHDPDTITLQNSKGQTLIVAKDQITAVALIG